MDKITRGKIPEFESAFLDQVCRQIEKRTKAWKKYGDYSWETLQPDDFEWLTLNFAPHVGNYVIIQFVEDNRVSLFIRSSRRHDRGKILFESVDNKVVNNAVAIVEAIETTIVNSTTIESDSSSVSEEEITRAWNAVLLRSSAWDM